MFDKMTRQEKLRPLEMFCWEDSSFSYDKAHKLVVKVVSEVIIEPSTEDMKRVVTFLLLRR